MKSLTRRYAPALVAALATLLVGAGLAVANSGHSHQPQHPDWWHGDGHGDHRQGPPGPEGPPGPPAAYQGPHWGVIVRNTIGSPVAELRPGPYTPTSSPPFGEGSLGMETANGTEKIAFGNEVDFLGDPVSGLGAVGFYVFVSGEDFGYGEPTPNITFEVDPNVAGKHYSSMVYVPSNSSLVANEWSGYIDAAAPVSDHGSEGWYFTNGTVAAETGCTQAHFCSLEEAQAGLQAHEEAPATILTVAVGKGRDSQWQGAVDGLRINGTVFNFEPLGVIEEAAE